MTELENAIHQWGYDKGILKVENLNNYGDYLHMRLKQAEKTKEELRELFDAIEANNEAEVMDAVGDIFVTLVMQVGLWNNIDSVEECAQSAYEIISKRTGKMVNGQFVKDQG